MQRTAKVQDRYYLKSIHQEIDLLDRKLAHLDKYEAFASDAERKSAESKLRSTRDALAQTALRLAEEGIAFSEADLPRSFRPAREIAETEQAEAPVVEAVPFARRVTAVPPSHFAGTSLDASEGLLAYKRSKGRRTPVAPLGAAPDEPLAE